MKNNKLIKQTSGIPQSFRLPIVSTSPILQSVLIPLTNLSNNIEAKLGQDIY